MGKWWQGQVWGNGETLCCLIQHWVNIRVRCGETGTLLSHPTLGERQAQVWGNTGTFCCLIQHWVNVRVKCAETLAHSALIQHWVNVRVLAGLRKQIKNVISRKIVLLLMHSHPLSSKFAMMSSLIFALCDTAYCQLLCASFFV